MLRVYDGDPSLIQCYDGDPVARRPDDGEDTVIQKIRVEDFYDGPTAVTPSSKRQTLKTKGKTIAENIVVDPIPSNYGLITWDGHKLRVS